MNWREGERRSKGKGQSGTRRHGKNEIEKGGGMGEGEGLASKEERKEDER